MSHAASHHTLSRYPNPRKVDDLRSEARDIVQRLRELHEEKLDTVTRYLYNLPTGRLVSDVQAEIRDLNEQLDLILAEFNHRRI